MDFAERMGKLAQEKEALAAGNPAAVERQRAAGRLTARERVQKLVDAGSFVETDTFMVDAGCVTGYGLVNQRPVYVLAQDATAHSGAMGQAQKRKMLRLLDLAQKGGGAVVLLPDSAGAIVTEGAAALSAYAQVFASLARLKGELPLIAVLAGPAIGSASQFAMLADVAIAVEGLGEVAPFPASVQNAVNGTAVEGKKLNGAQALAAKGAVALTAKGEAEGFDLARQVIDLLPCTAGEGTPVLEGDDLNRLIAVPAADSTALTASIADAGSLVELFGAWKLSARTYLARIGGHACGIVSCSPEEDGGRLDAWACDKIAKLVNLCGSYGLPVITLVDSQGLVVPPQGGEPWLMTASARMLSAYANLWAPKLAVITGNAVGAAYVNFAGRDMADLCLAWPTAYIAPLTQEAAVQTFEADRVADEGRDKLEQEAFEGADAFVAAAHGLVDDVIDPAQTRKHLIAGLELLADRAGSL